MIGSRIEANLCSIYRIRIFFSYWTPYCLSRGGLTWFRFNQLRKFSNLEFMWLLIFYCVKLLESLKLIQYKFKKDFSSIEKIIDGIYWIFNCLWRSYGEVSDLDHRKTDLCREIWKLEEINQTSPNNFSTNYFCLQITEYLKDLLRLLLTIISIMVINSYRGLDCCERKRDWDEKWL